MARLRINWRTLTTVAPQAAATGDATVKADARTSLRAERPMMIYVLAEDPTDIGVRKLEDIVFVDERVGLGAKFFDTIKVSAGDAMQDRILKDAGRKYSPRIVFMSRGYKVTSVMKGKQLSASKLLKSMKSLARKEYVSSFDKLVTNYRKLLNEIDRLEGKKANLAQQMARLEGKRNASKAKKLAREQRKLDAEFGKLAKKEKALTALKPRGKKPEA